jgi:hypothetical protein
MRLWIAAAAAIALVGTGCSGAHSAAAVSPAPAASPTSSQVSTASSPSRTAGPDVLVNNTGHFSFRHPADWTFLNCDPASPGVGLAIRAGAPPYTVNCGGESCYFAMLITSVPGDRTADAPATAGCMQHVSDRTSTTVTVDGIPGVRITDTFTAGSDTTGGFGPDPGTHQVLYAVYDGTRTYLALYQRQPNQPDETAPFDDLMQRMFMFV